MPDGAAVTTKITVYHSVNSRLNNGYTEFSGESLEHAVLDDGSLLIKNWRSTTERGHARFAAGQWSCVFESQPRLT